MSIAVTLTARDVVRSSFVHREDIILRDQREHLETLRNRCQGMMGYIAANGLTDGVLNRACMAGALIATDAIRLLPREWSNPFLILMALPRPISEYEDHFALRRYFDRAFNDTAKFLDGDDPEGVPA
ncbi:hypothetical protein D1227_06240 [Henriciella mobilis]|uniref:hypothetical protein n=1 Tax=Henriciella mobilis TaxID=2305467 RepID=UPI000E66D1D3|nr:hypothetical protein [Henriciella mobilis]RIJ15989.1 hypothetical protein D1231_09360 [Henriciella mobilis]RIJ21199.1 hypothetical protein D1227_12900 [Henriciella mobilis]RIJ23100.1 hypothetical protein D1227_06240 [Henriciella mobilis]